MAGEIEMIPEGRRDAVRAAVSAAFGAQATGPLHPVSGGTSGALIFRFENRNRPYVLRLEPEHIARRDWERGLACMAAAAQAGAAPALHYVEATTGVTIMDFVAARPLAEHPGGPAGLARDLGALTARVQATAPFPILDDYPKLIEHLLSVVSRSGLLPPGALDQHADGLARISAALPWEAATLVSSHNDPNPRNILFDGERLWLVDWELGFLNDPLVDVAILTSDLAEGPELETLVLEAVFGRAPDRVMRARLQVIGLLTRLFYGSVVLGNYVDAPRSGPDASPAFTQAEFRSALADGRLTSGASETAYAFGKMSLETFAGALKAPGFDELLQVVAQG